jgi:hypothetical protein
MTNLSTVPPELRMKALSANNIELAVKWHMITEEQAKDKFRELMESIDLELLGDFVLALKAGGGPIAKDWLAVAATGERMERSA